MEGLFLKCCDLARKYHAGQKYGEKDYYFEHLMGVVKLCRIAGWTDALTLSLAVMHDIMKDTDIDHEEVPEEIREYVKDLTKCCGISYDHYIEEILCCDLVVRRVKTMDVLFNLLQSLETSPKRVSRYLKAFNKLINSLREEC